MRQWQVREEFQSRAETPEQFEERPEMNVRLNKQQKGNFIYLNVDAEKTWIQVRNGHQLNVTPVSVRETALLLLTQFNDDNKLLRLTNTPKATALKWNDLIEESYLSSCFRLHETAN